MTEAAFNSSVCSYIQSELKQVRFNSLCCSGCLMIALVMTSEPQFAIVTIVEVWNVVFLAVQSYWRGLSESC